MPRVKRKGRIARAIGKGLLALTLGMAAERGVTHVISHEFYNGQAERVARIKQGNTPEVVDRLVAEFRAKREKQNKLVSAHIRNMPGWNHLQRQQEEDFRAFVNGKLPLDSYAYYPDFALKKYFPSEIKSNPKRTIGFGLAAAGAYGLLRRKKKKTN